MMRKTYVMAIAIGLAALAPGFAGQASQQDRQKAMELYMKLGAVNENHAYFQRFVGQWTVAATMWAFPGAPPATSRNTAAAELILGGRFLRMTFRGSMMGMPFEGHQITGYDNLQKKYISFWIDNTSTAFYLTTGVRDAASETMTEDGLWPDPMSGGQVKVRNVLRWLGPDEFTYSSYMTLPDGKEFKSLEQRAVRIR